MVSKTIITGGIPRGYDGKNFFSQELGSDYGKDYIWRRLMWLPYYVLAGFYILFGETTFISRLPFALFGFCTIILTYFFTKSLWKKTSISLLAPALLTLSVPFLLLCRQCRYYSVTMFFSLFSLYAYILLVKRKKYSSILLFGVMAFLFHSQHIYLGVVIATLFVHSVIFHRDRFKAVLMVTVSVLTVNSPWIIWLTGINFSVAYGTNVMPKLKSILLMLSDIHNFILPLWVVIIVICLFIFKLIRHKNFLIESKINYNNISLFLFFIIFNMMAILVVSPFPFFRYLAPSIPMLIILMTAALVSFSGIHKTIPIIIIVVILFSGQMKDYLYEITHDFDGPAEGIINYLNEHGKENDVVAITYGDMPLKFYTKMRIIGGLTGEDLEPALNARWVIIRKYHNCDKDIAVKKFLLENIKFDRYRKIVLDYPDTLYENREYPAVHFFRTQVQEDRIAIYEKIY